MNILDTIVREKRSEVRLLESSGLHRPDDTCRGGNRASGRCGFRQAVTSEPAPRIIAEVKRASPSKGIICSDFDPEAIAAEYERDGASAISVLTDRKFFQGSLEIMCDVIRATTLPVLRKDFIVAHIQVEEAALWGADAILLITAVLDGALLAELIAHASERGMDALVEVHDPGEAERALRAGADLIGVNNRNLKDFTVSLENTFTVREAVGNTVPVVSESGINTAEDLLRLRDAGICAALIGEALVRERGALAHLLEDYSRLIN